MPAPKGHPKWGGKKKGHRTAATLDKVMAREVLREQVIAALVPMTRAQIANAIGIGHLYTRDKTGKFTKIENEAKADELLTKGEEGKDYWIFMKDPSVQAYTDLLNRALDKPKEQELEVAVRTTTSMTDAELTALAVELSAKLRS